MELFPFTFVVIGHQVLFLKVCLELIPINLYLDDSLDLYEVFPPNQVSTTQIENNGPNFLIFSVVKDLEVSLHP